MSGKTWTAKPILTRLVRPAIVAPTTRGEDRTGICPEAELLVAVLELDPEAAREHREIVLDRDRALGLEAADQPLATVIDRRERLRAAGARPVDLVKDQSVPRLLAELRLDVDRAESAEPRLGPDVDEAQARHRFQ